jgi:hypothetical protein
VVVGWQQLAERAKRLAAASSSSTPSSARLPAPLKEQ